MKKAVSLIAVIGFSCLATAGVVCHHTCPEPDPGPIVYNTVYSCYVGSRSKVDFYAYATNLPTDPNGPLVYVYSRVETDQDIQTTPVCQRYKKIGQACEILGCGYGFEL